MLTVRALKRLHISVSFDLRDGECVALQGPSGVGKTLLLRSIADLDPNEGIIKLDGKLREAMPAPVWRTRVTYVAAEPGWWSDTVREHFLAWDNALPLVTRLGCHSACKIASRLTPFRTTASSRTPSWPQPAPGWGRLFGPEETSALLP